MTTSATTTTTTTTTTTATRRARLLAPFAAALAVAAAIASAPAAAATANPSNCQERGTVRMCQKQGHASLHAEPTVRNPNGSLFSSAWLPGYGRGHLPPLIALD